MPITTTLIRRLLGLPVPPSGWAATTPALSASSSGSTRLAGASPDTLWTGAAATTSASPSQGGKDPTQQEKAKAFISARYWARRIEFVRATLNLRLAFLNYGLTFSPGATTKPGSASATSSSNSRSTTSNSAATNPTATKSTPAPKTSPSTSSTAATATTTSNNAFDQWLVANEAKARRYVRQVWRQWLMQSNVVSFWREGSDLPMTLVLDKCRYRNTLGMEELWYTHGLSSEDLNAIEDKAVRERYRKSAEIKLDENEGEHFRVLTPEEVGEGFGMPELYSIFVGCSQWDAMAAGDLLLAEEGRVLLKQHRLGHEIKTGAHAGSPVHFIKKARVEELKKELNGKVGKVELPTNFDHDVRYVYVDGKFYDNNRYDGVERKLLWWSTPIGQMIQTRGGVAPFLMDLLRVQVHDARSLIGPHVSEVLSEALGAPDGGIQVRWSDRIFRDSRLVADLLKFGLTTGPLSQRTWREEAGYDDDEERKRKGEEWAQPDAEKLPVFDASHGKRPQDPTSGSGGRPVGTSDNTSTSK